MPQYLRSVWHDEPYDDIDFNSPDMQRMVTQVSDFNASLEKAGAWVFAERRPTVARGRWPRDPLTPHRKRRTNPLRSGPDP